MVGIGAVLVLITVIVLALHLGSAVLTRHHAEAAADLAALAAAAHAAAGEAEACATARRVTNGMAVRMTSCELQGWDAIVRTEAVPAVAIADLGMARAAARAGPAPPGDITDAARRRTVDDPR